MRKIKSVLSIILCLLMIMACVIPVFAEGDGSDTCEHQWEWVIDVYPSVSAHGLQHQMCTLCEATQNYGTVAHYFQWVVDSAPTCGDYGIKHQECFVCNQGVKQNEGTPIEPTGNHTLQWVLDTPPTCGVPGVQHQYCSVCQQSLNEGTPVAATGAHIWEWVIDIAPTCGASGTKHERCTCCGQTNPLTDGTYVPPTEEHVWIAGDIISESTCVVPGEQKYTCDVCSSVKTEYLPLKDHTWGEGVVSLAPSCSVRGYMVYTCTVEGCGAQKSEYIPATGEHVDADGNGQCDVCGVSIPSGTNSVRTIWDIFQSFMDFINNLMDRIRTILAGG